MELQTAITTPPNILNCATGLMNRVAAILGNYHDVLQDVTADLIFTSPPYNIGSKGERKSGAPANKYGRTEIKSYGAITDYPDSLPEPDYQQQQVEFFLWAADHLSQNGTLIYNHKVRRRNKSMIHPGEWFLRPEVTRRLQLMEEIIWDRGSTHNHDQTMMWPTTERLYAFRRTDGKYRLKNTSALTFRSDVWRINRARNNGHNAPFPVELAEAVIQAWSETGDVVCDPYMGSGTTAIASNKLDREFVGAEVLEKYYQLAVDRIFGTIHPNFTQPWFEEALHQIAA